MRRSPRVWPMCALLALACARPGRSASPRGPFDGPSGLRANLEGGGIALAWTQGAREDGGAWIEFATPGSDFVKLAVAWPGTTRFVHDELAPGTTFIYRLIPFFGRASAPVTVTTGAAAAGEPGEEGPLEEPRAGPHAGQPSLRSPQTIAEAAPSNLRVVLAAPTSAELRWEDRAADEDGYLVELATGGGGFQVCALLPVGATSFRKVALPAAKPVTFRVRAFFLGPPTSTSAATTPSDGPR